MWSNIVFGAFLIAFAAVMLARHRAAWQAASEDELGEQEHDYLRRQYRRRLQASAMIGLVGIAVVVGIWFTDTVAAAVYWGAVALVVCWIGLLAVADLISTRMYFHSVRKGQLEEQAALQTELDRIKRRDGDGNGKPRNEPGDNSTYERT